ncbi:MAG TPA: hypothetical protein VHB79_25040 [Polyangiaceae bacterium]|nr:hypothetical protein [Polyangiaceae bacterium]
MKASKAKEPLHRRFLNYAKQLGSEPLRLLRGTRTNHAPRSVRQGSSRPLTKPMPNEHAEAGLSP